LTTVQPDDENYADTGMRFEEIDASHFRCPQCRHVLVVMDEEEARNGG
jgi:rubredoxin